MTARASVLSAVALALVACSSSSSNGPGISSGGTGEPGPSNGTGGATGPVGSPDAGTTGTGGTQAGLVGLWDGSYLIDDDPTQAPFEFVIVVDHSYTGYLAGKNGSGRGLGTLSASGDVVITVTGEALETVTYSGHFLGDTGSGVWTNSASNRSGTWTVSRRKGAVVSPDARATCDLLDPCFADPAAPLDPLAVVSCMISLAAPTPLISALMAALRPCLSAPTCDGRLACLSQGTLPIVYVSSLGKDSNDGASPASPKQTLGAAVAAAQPGGSVLVAAGTYRENVLVGKPLTIAGGYDATFAQVDPSTSVVTIDGQKQDSTVAAFLSPGIAGALVLRGLHVINGEAQMLSFGGSGGGLNVGGAGAEVVLEDCVFSGNHAPRAGGGVSLSDSKLTVTRCTFENNVADGNGGGGINISDGTLQVTGSIFRNNQGGDYGGAINAWQTTTAIEGTTASGNSARKCGGGFQLGGDTTHTLKDCALSGNTPNNTCGPYTNLGGNTMN